MSHFIRVNKIDYVMNDKTLASEERTRTLYINVAQLLAFEERERGMMIWVGDIHDPMLIADNLADFEQRLRGNAR